MVELQRISSHLCGLGLMRWNGRDVGDALLLPRARRGPEDF